MKCAIFEEHSSSCVFYSRFSGTLFPVSMIDGVNGVMRNRKIPTLGSKIQWETWQTSFPIGTVGPWFWTFLSPLNTNDGFYLSQIPVLARGKDKNRKATRRPIADRTSIRDVIVMLKLRHYVASQHSSWFYNIE